MTDYTTRNLTTQEADDLMRGLHLALGTTTAVDSVMRVLADHGVGIFKAEEASPS